MTEPGNDEELVAEDSTKITEVPLEALEALSGGGSGEEPYYTMMPF